MKLIMMKGLPGSGKSTIAQTLMDNNTVRLNKDLLREMLHYSKFSFKNESLTKKAEYCIANEALKNGRNVIIDDTNLGSLEKWENLAKEHGAEFIVKEVSTDWRTCIVRDAIRGKNGGRSIGAPAIIGMALFYGRILIDKPVVIVDLDGTICDIEHRLHYVRRKEGEGEDAFWQKDWKSFFKELTLDTLRQDVHDQVAKLAEDHEIIFVSGRPEEYKKETLEWLEKNVTFPWLTVLMRRLDDKRPDTEVKKEIYEKFFKGLKVTHVFDDRPCVIRLWRELGLNVIDVGSGVEF